MHDTKDIIPSDVDVYRYFYATRRYLIVLIITFLLSGCKQESESVTAPANFTEKQIVPIVPNKEVATGTPQIELPVRNEITELLEEDRIKSELAIKYEEYADTINDTQHLGTASDHIARNENNCYILGKLLGFENEVKHLQLPHDGDLTTRTDDNAQMLRTKAQEFENFGPKLFIGLPKSEQITLWNLDCAGKYQINAPMLSQDGFETFYKIDGNTMQVLGDIENGFSRKLIDAINSNPDVDTIALGSRGGSVLEAITAGNFIRARGLNTVLWNGCYSACPLVFLGGIERHIWAPYPELGLHQMSIDDEPIPLNDNAYSVIYNYVNSMGADGKFVVYHMWLSGPDQMNVITSDDMICESNVATWVQRVCWKNKE